MNYFSWRFGRQCAAACDESLAEHDKKYHPNGFDPEIETCNKRAELAKADKGDVLSPSEGDDKGGGDKPLVSAAEDAAYMDAVNRGDMETAAKMVREVAARSGFDSKKTVYHAGFLGLGKGTENNSVDVKRFHEGLHVGTLRAAIDRFEAMAEKDWDFIGDGKLDWWFTEKDLSEAAKDFEKAKKIIEGNNTCRLHSFFLKNGIREREAQDITETGGNWGDVIEELEREDIDVIKYRNGAEDSGSDSYVILTNSIKSADPVTYDDDGNVIPLSRRFDGGDDIRGNVSGN